MGWRLLTAAALLLLTAAAAASAEVRTRITIDGNYTVLVAPQPYGVTVVPASPGSLTVYSNGSAAISPQQPFVVTAPPGTIVTGDGGCSVYIVVPSTGSVSWSPCSSGRLIIHSPRPGGALAFAAVRTGSGEYLTVVPAGSTTVTVYDGVSRWLVVQPAAIHCPGCTVVGYHTRSGPYIVLRRPHGIPQPTFNASVLVRFAENPVTGLVSAAGLVGEWGYLVLYVFPAAVHIARRSPTLTGTSAILVSMLVALAAPSRFISAVSLAVLAASTAAVIYHMVRSHD